MIRRTSTLLTIALALSSILLALTPNQVIAQEAEYRLDVNRDFGYGNGSDIRGNFSLRIYGPIDTIRTVIYQMDGQEIGQVNEAPFVFRFVTSDYPDGWHELSAVIVTTDGRQITTPPVRLNFVSSAQQADAMKRIFGFTIILLVILGAIGAGSQFLATRGAKPTTPGAPRKYGLLGGTICPRCNRPFPIHIWSINLVGGRLDRCENCGKWTFVQRRHPDELAAAERAELAAAKAEENALPGAVEETEEEKLRRLLDESRYRKL